MTKFEKYIKEIQLLLFLALPLMFAQLFNSGKGIVDTMMVGHIDKFNLAGLSLANGVYMVIILFSAGISIALISVVSKFHAQKDFANITFYSQQALYLNTFISIIITIILLNCGFLFNSLTNLDSRTIEIASGYLKIMGYVYPIVALVFVLRAIMQAFIKNKQILVISGALFFLNIPLNYLFIYQFNWGALGSAYSTAICSLLEVMFLFLYVIKHHEMNIFTRLVKIDFKRVGYLFALATPIGLSIMSSVAVFTAISFMLSKYGEVYISAHNIALNFLGFIFMFSLGLNFALVQRVSFYIGLEDNRQIKTTVISSVILCLSYIFITMMVTLFFKNQIAALYTSNPKIITIAANILLISMMYQVFDGMQSIGSAVLRSYKLSKEAFKIALFSYWGIGFGVGYLLSKEFGVYGYWYALCLCLMTASSLYYIKIYKVVWQK